MDPDPGAPLIMYSIFVASEKWYVVKYAVLRIPDVYSRSRIQIFSIPDQEFFYPGSRICIKEFSSILTQKMVSKLSEIWSGLFIPDPDPDFLPILDAGSKGQKAPDPGSGSATLQISRVVI